MFFDGNRCTKQERSRRWIIACSSPVKGYAEPYHFGAKAVPAAKERAQAIP